MKINYFIHQTFLEPEIRICNHELTEDMKQLYHLIDQSVNAVIMGYREGEVSVLRANDIYRVYSENQKTIAETEKSTFHIHMTLSLLEEQLPEGEFVRISRSEIVNIRKIKKIDTSIARTIQMYLKNGSRTYVSRRNVTQIKKILGI